MNSEHIADRINSFIREQILDGDQDQELNGRTPLLEWGILNSFNTFRLVSFIREDLDVVVPVIMINPDNFGNIESITAMVAGLVPDKAAAAPERG